MRRGFFKYSAGSMPRNWSTPPNGLDHDGHDLVAHLVDPADVDVGDDVLESIEAHPALRGLEIRLAERLEEPGRVLDVAAGGIDGLVDGGHRRVGERGGGTW